MPSFVVTNLFRSFFQSPLLAARRMDDQRSKDLQYSGRGRILGTVKEKSTPTNVPVVRRVVLHVTRGSVPIRETWSDAAGNYLFEGIDPALTYFVVSFDHSGDYRAVIADNLIPDPMP